MNLTHRKSRHRSSQSLVLAVVILGTLAALCGCGQSGPARVPVHGKVTFAGGVPPADGTLVFTPVRPAEGCPARPGRAKFTQGDGAFTATSIQPGDGLMPGVYHVNIECWQRPPTDDTQGISHVPANYAPPELEIKVDDTGPVTYEFDVHP